MLCRSYMVVLILNTLFTLSCSYTFNALTVRSAPNFNGRGGVVFLDRWRAQKGIRIATSYDGRGCDAISETGKRLARFPGGYCLFLPGDQYFSVLDGPALFDPDFSIVWSRKDLHQHHDATYDRARDWIWLLTDNGDKEFNDKRDFLHDTLIALDRKTGKTVFSWSALKEREKLERALGSKMTSDYSPVLKSQVWSHFNSIDVVQAGEGGVARAGDLVLGETRHGLVFIFRPETREIVWSRTIGMGVGHHSGKYLENGNILVFINGTDSAEPKHSYWAEIAPGKDGWAWSQSANPPRNVYCDHFGYAERLPNGNTLVSHIVEHTGAAFEITREGRIVWEWYNDERDSEGRPLETYRLTFQPENIVQPYIERWNRMQGENAKKNGVIAGLESEFLTFAQRRRGWEVLVSRTAANEAEARKLMTEREEVLLSLFKEYPSPYPGAITTKSRCGPEFQPQRVTDENEDLVLRAFNLSSNARLAYGDCSPDQKKLHSIYFLLYCRKQNLLYDVKLFYPPEEHSPRALPWIQAIHCGKI